VTAIDPNLICKLGPVPAGASYYAKKMCENRKEMTRGQIDEAISRLGERCREAAVAHEVAYEKGDTFDLIISHARYNDLTVFGLRSLFEYEMVQDPEKDLIRLLSQGVRPILAVSKVLHPIHRVMVAYSGSMESAKAMRRFVQFRLWPNAPLEIIHFGDDSESNNRLVEDAAAYCRDHDYTASTRIFAGNAADRLVAVAQDSQADLIVMGNSIRSIWLRKALGDTVLKTLSETDRPLFLSQ
jgi:nucleotide-binding universal stress UspA family protein